MKINHFHIILALILCSNAGFGQSDTLNQVDSNGLKQGYWIVYLNADWKVVSDSTQASYQRYAYYINNGNLYPMASWGKKGYTLKKNGVIIKAINGNSAMLNGKYEWYDQKGRILSTHVLKNGIYQSYTYYDKSGRIKGGYLVNEQCGSTPLDYCIFNCDKEGKRIKSPIPRDATGKPINRE